jgi:hypothetical protein
LIERSRECIELLLQTSDGRDLEGVIRETFERDNLAEGDSAELLSTWETEKHLIFKKLIT